MTNLSTILGTDFLGYTGSRGFTGSQGNIGFTGSQGNKGGLRYNFSTTTTNADPGTGVVRFNNATISSVTEIYIDNQTQEGTDVTAYLNTWDDSTSPGKGFVEFISNASGDATIAIFEVTAVAAPTGYRTLTVLYVTGTLPSNGEELVVLYSKTGDLGYTGSRGFTGSQGVIGYTGSAPTTVSVSANNTTNATYYPTFVAGQTGNQSVETDVNLTYNPSTNVLSTTASQAQYADLAEYFLADVIYPVGTVLMLGGDKEVTAANKVSRNIIGTVSEKPAYVMNNKLSGEHKTAVAYIGRVPVRVMGTINVGDWLIVSDIPGVAIAADPDTVKPGQFVGKALESHNDLFEGLIEVLVGRM